MADLVLSWNLNKRKTKGVCCWYPTWCEARPSSRPYLQIALTLPPSLYPCHKYTLAWETKMCLKCSWSFFPAALFFPSPCPNPDACLCNSAFLFHWPVAFYALVLCFCAYSKMFSPVGTFRTTIKTSQKETKEGEKEWICEHVAKIIKLNVESSWCMKILHFISFQDL